MAKESDADTYVIQIAEIWEDVAFNDTFTAAPAVVCLYNQLDMEKLCVSDITTTGFKIQGKKTGNAGWIALEKGFDNDDPQKDAGTHTIEILKAWEAVAFGDTFDSTPEVSVTTSGATPLKKAGAQAITTTGFDCYSEVAENVDWIAREKEFA